MAPQGLTFGDTGRNSLNIPNRLNFDMALFKNFPIKESYAFQFRAEAFNIFNHTQWNGVNSSISLLRRCEQFRSGLFVHGGRLVLAVPATFRRAPGPHFPVWLEVFVLKNRDSKLEVRNSKTEKGAGGCGALFYFGAWLSQNEERSLTAFGMTASLLSAIEIARLNAAATALAAALWLSRPCLR